MWKMLALLCREGDGCSWRMCWREDTCGQCGLAIANSILSKYILSSQSLKWFDVFNTSAWKLFYLFKSNTLRKWRVTDHWSATSIAKDGRKRKLSSPRMWDRALIVLFPAAVQRIIVWVRWLHCSSIEKKLKLQLGGGNLYITTSCILFPSTESLIQIIV